MEQPINTLKRRLMELSSLTSKSNITSEKIKQAAADRLDVVNQNIKKLRPRVIQDDAAAELYKKYVYERGQLSLLIGKSK